VNGNADNPSIPAETYSREYLLSPSLEGYAEFLDGGLSSAKHKQLLMLDLGPGIDLLEIGFGRGEFLRHCAGRCRSATGIDYSQAAWEIAVETLRGTPNASVQVADCRALPFAAAAFDSVYSGDVIEHLSASDGQRMLSEAWRVLRPGGTLLIHTSPNAAFMRFVYPLARRLLSFGNRAAIERLDAHLDVGRHVHLHEYDLRHLKRAARLAGMDDVDAWIDADILRSGASWHTQTLQANPLVRLAAMLGRLAPLRYFLGNDLYLRCRKP